LGSTGAPRGREGPREHLGLRGGKRTLKPRGLPLNHIISGIENIVRVFGPTFQLALGLVLAVALVHAVSFVWYRLQQRGQRPLVIQLRATYDGTRQTAGHALDARLLAYLAADGQGAYVIAPGAGFSQPRSACRGTAAGR